MKAYRVCGACLAWFAVLAQYQISVAQSGFAQGSLVYFGFFTVLSNILVALAYTAPVLPAGTSKAFFTRTGVRTAIAVYILVVAVIFYCLLRKLYHPTGLGWFVNILLHYINPPLFLLDWAMFVPKRELKFRQLPAWMIFPLAYAGYVLAHGAASGYYPYPFLDAGSLGYPKTLCNIGGLTMMFLVVSGLFVATGRILPWPRGDQ